MGRFVEFRGGVLLVLRFGVFGIVVTLAGMGFSNMYVFIKGVCATCLNIYLKTALLPPYSL